MLNAQPMGFYAPAQLVRDAREHGVEVREVDINFSEWNSTLENEARDGLPTLALPHRGGTLLSLPLAGEGRGGGNPTAASHSARYVPPRQREEARALRRDQTRAEALIWREVRAHRLAGLGFRRQVPMGRYIADFVCHAAKVVVEVDGDAHRDHEARDRERDEWFRSRGYRTLRFRNEDVVSYPERVVEEIRGVCVGRLAPDPGTSPPPLRGRARGGEGAASMGFPPPRPSPARGEGGRPFRIRGGGPPKHRRVRLSPHPGPPPQGRAIACGRGWRGGRHRPSLRA